MAPSGGKLRSLRALGCGANQDVLSNLLSVSLPDGRFIEYLVDAAGRRVGKKVDGVLVQQWLYRDALKPIAELDGSGHLAKQFFYGTSGLVPEFMTIGTSTYRIISDQLGSPRMAIDIANGSIVAKMQHSAFGEVLQDTNPGLLPFGFAGGLYDVDTGLVRFGARDHDATVGRWTAKDSLLLDAGTNVYAYAKSDPVNYCDWTGLAPTRAEIVAAYDAAYENWWQNRPDRVGHWGPVSNWLSAFGDETAPVCSDYAEAAAAAMNQSVNIDGTGAYAVWNFQTPTSTLGKFDSPWDAPFDSHSTVHVYEQTDSGPELVAQYDPWWRPW